MRREAFIAIYALVLVALIIGVDVAFLKGLFWQRLAINAAIVAAFAAFYLIVLRHAV